MSGIKFINTQREKILRISNILIILGTCLNLSGMVGEQESINIIIVLSYLLIISCITVVEYFIKYNNIRIMIGIRSLATQLLICSEMILLAYSNNPNKPSIIETNMSVLMIIILLSLLGYLKFYTYILSITSVACYGYCAYIIDNPEMLRNLSIYILLFSICAYLSTLLTKGINTIINKNKQYKIDIQEALETMGLTEEEFNAHLDLAKKNKKRGNPTVDLFNIIGDRAQETLKKNVTYLMEQDKIIYDKLGKYIPEFTPSEIEIAKLIAEGKKIGEITEILNKKKSNITCQRTKMRVKLNLSKEDNLRDAILKRVIVE